MPFKAPHASRHHRWVWGLRLWVLTVLMLGTLVSSLGQVHSHGLAALVSAQHESAAAHGHSHGDDEAAAPHAGGDLGHAHHNSADHSHDKAHALPPHLAVAPGATPVWRPLAHPLAPGHSLFRLDRPPMA